MGMNALKEKIALIIGAGDQRGIGYACAEALAEQGATGDLSTEFLKR